MCIRDRPFAVINADDYYGKEAFVQLHDVLQGYTPDKSGDLAMAGFVLKNTLSDNGAVTRGICQMNYAHYLTGVLETSGIEMCIRDRNRSLCLTFHIKVLNSASTIPCPTSPNIMPNSTVKVLSLIHISRRCGPGCR